MAERRMFAKSLIDSDLFLDMPLSTQALYFHLSMRADDEGFVNNPKKILRMIGANEDSLKILIAKQFILPFDSGIVVIKHWRIHNYIQKDRFKKTTYTEEKALIVSNENGEYDYRTEPLDTTCIQDVSNSDTQVRLGKVSIGKVSIGKDSIELGDSKGEEKPSPSPTPKPTKHRFGEFNHVLLTDDEYSRLCNDYGKGIADKYIQKVDEYCEMKGKSYKNYNLAIRNTFMARDNVRPRTPERDISQIPDEQLSVQDQILKKLRC